MKTVISFLTFVLLAFSPPFSQEAKANNVALENFFAADEREVTIPIEGMSCMSCVGRIKKTLSSLEGVNEVKVSLQERNAVIKYDPEKITAEKLQKSINGIIYSNKGLIIAYDYDFLFPYSNYCCSSNFGFLKDLIS